MLFLISNVFAVEAVKFISKMKQAAFEITDHWVVC